MHTDPDQVPEDIPVPPGEDTDDEPTPPLPADPGPDEPARDPAVNTAMAANDPNVPPPEPVRPLSTPPNPGQVQPTPEPM